MTKSTRIIISVCIVSICLLEVFADSFHSVPLDNRVYQIISVAELRGLIPHQTDVKPYNVKTVMDLLDVIEKKTSDSPELVEISNIRRTLMHTYGMDVSNTSKEILHNGFYRITDKKQGNSLAIGTTLKTKQTGGINFNKANAFDSRSTLLLFFCGDLYSFLSYEMNFGVRFDKLDPNAFLESDFTFDAEGFYQTIGGEGKINPPMDQIFVSYEYSPEISMGFFDNKLQLRISSIRHDWGPGLGNPALSKSARSMPAFELHTDLFSFFHFSFLTGSLEKFLLDSSNGKPWYSDGTNKSNLYDNNFSTQRIEIDFAKNFRFSIFESVVWKKRYEFAYLNPFSIFMFDQNALGDYDNVLAGIDLSLLFPERFRVYGALAFTEMGAINPLKARCVFGIQGGVEIPLHMFSFSKLTIQGVYLSPFFYSHYLNENNPWNKDVPFRTDYVNKGQLLGYPLEPDSLELLAQLSCGFSHGFEGNVVVKYQMKSAQYATADYGTTILTAMDYSNESLYAKKDFFSYIWSHIVSLEFIGSKKFEQFPVEISGSIRLEGDFTRSFSHPTTTNYGSDTILGDWNKAIFGIFGSIGIKLYY